MSNSNVSRLLDRDVFQFQLGAVAEEMSATIRRSAFSPIIWDMLDYSCAVFTPQGEMLAQAETIAAQLGVMGFALKGISQAIPIDTWNDGDVVMCNDPYRGCTHTPDIVLFSPVFASGRLIAITSTIAHHVDIGGRVPSTTSPDNIEVFGEGLIFPPAKLMDRGTRNDTVMAFIAANVRRPQACSGDLAAQIAGCRTGERRVRELAAKYGLGRFAELCGECLDYGERYTRSAITTLPHSRRTAETLMEDDVSSEQPIRLRATVTIDAQGIEVDFAGTDAQRPNALNCPLSSTLSMTLYAIRCLTAPEGPRNEGGNRLVRIRVPEGSVLNPRRPGAVGNRHFAQQAVADVVLKALVDLFPDGSAAGCQISFPALRAGGFDTRDPNGSPKYFILHDIIGGGMGAFAGGDGLNAVDTHGGNCGVMSAELVESSSPIRVIRSELVDQSGGNGQFRGGLGMRRDYQMLVDGLIVSVYLQQNSETTAPWGIAGGGRGRPGSACLNPGTPDEKRLPSKAMRIDSRKGDIVRIEGAGGGGWGRSQDRSPEAIEHDKENHYVQP